MTETPEQDTGATTEARQQVQAKAQQAQGKAQQAQDQVREQAEHQTRRTADTVRHWADDLATMAERAPADSPARDVVTRAADGGRRAADYLDEHGAGGVAHDVQDFARQRPAAFLGGAALAGFAVGRMAKAGRKQWGEK